MENKIDFKKGERVVFTAWATQQVAAQALGAGAQVFFCDIDLGSRGADYEHLKELVLQGASKFITFCDDEAADFARKAGVEVIILAEKEGDISPEDMHPAYDSDAFRYAIPPQGQYPYYMLCLNGVETLCRQLRGEA